MEYLHTMVRVADLDQSLDFYCNKLGLVETRRIENEKGRYTLVFLAAAGRRRAGPRDQGAARRAHLQLGSSMNTRAGATSATSPTASTTSTRPAASSWTAGVTINRPPRDGNMAFVRSPDNISIELLQRGEAKAPAEPWASMPNTGVW